MTSCGSKYAVAGFSLVEIIITVAIIGMLAAAAGLNYLNQDPDGIAQRTVSQMRSTVNLARSYAVTGRECCGGTVPNGYGVYLELDGTPDREYTLYADTDGDFQYTASGDEVIQTGVLTTDVSFSQCELGASIITAPGSCDVLFTRVDFERLVYYNGVQLPGPDKVRIIATHENEPAATAHVEVLPFSIVVQ